MNRLHYLLTIFSLLFCITFLAQDDGPVLIFSGKVTDISGKKLSGVKVIVKQDNKPFNESITSSSGKYNVVEAPFGHQYTLIFEKEGLVTKTLILDTKKRVLRRRYRTTYIY